MAGLTTRGKRNLFNSMRGVALPTNFYIALIVKKNEKSINNGDPAVNKGGGKVGIPCAAHGYAVGSRVSIEGTTNYGTILVPKYYIVDATSSANEIVVIETFVAETFLSTAKVHQAPGPDTNQFSEFTEIAAGNGYAAGGYQIFKNTTDFDGLIEDDSADKATLLLKDISWVGTGGNIPISGPGARYALLTDDNVIQSNREIWAYWPLTSDRSVSNTQSLTLQDLSLNIAEV